MRNPSFDMRHAVTNLLYHEVAYVPFSAKLIAEAKQAYLSVISELQEFDDEARWTRVGEREYDLGLILRRGEFGTDHKDFFHFAHDLVLRLTQELPEAERLVKSELQVLQRLYDEVNQLAFRVAHTIDVEHGQFFSRPLEPEIRQAAKMSQPYATTTLRGLYYPPIVGQTGARTHIDRSLFSIHFGDEGGQLMTRNGEHGRLHHPVTIPEGHVAMFRGVKMWFLSRRKFHPTWHYSTTVPGKPRLAMVQFIQARIPGMDLYNAYDAYHMFRAIQ